MGSGINKNDCKSTLYHLVTFKKSIDEVIAKKPSGNFDVIPSNRELVVGEVELMQSESRESALKQNLNEVESIYDYIIVDCPPTLNLLTINSFVAITGVIIPMQCEYFSL